MKNCTTILSGLALCSAFSTLAFAATVERDTSVLSGSWSEASSWVGGQVPADGDTVKKGQTLCVLEAMKMMSEVPAPCDCVILEILAKDGDLVGFDAPLFQVREL